ncbi:MAG: hypothetical protein ACO24D_16125 [bacterium]
MKSNRRANEEGIQSLCELSDGSEMQGSGEVPQEKVVCPACGERHTLLWATNLGYVSCWGINYLVRMDDKEMKWE